MSVQPFGDGLLAASEHAPPAKRRFGIGGVTAQGMVPARRDPQRGLMPIPQGEQNDTMSLFAL